MIVARLGARPVSGFWRKALRRARGALWGALRVNPYVYDACARTHTKWPDITVRPVELYGQCGEDLIVLALLEAKALRDGIDLRHRRYLEIGGNHPFATSATYLLNRRLGMTGVIVEANPRLIAGLAKGRPDDVVVHGAVHAGNAPTVTLSVARQSEISSLDRDFVLAWAHGAVGEAERVEVAGLRINDIIRAHFDGESPCFLSVDVEGLDLALLRDLDFTTYRPWLVQAEPSEGYIPGNTKAIVAHMRAVGYALIARTSVNLIFADSRG
jgi:hypothetical protein